MSLEAIFLVEKEVVNRILLLDEVDRFNYLLKENENHKTSFDNYIVDMEDFIGTSYDFQLYINSFLNSKTNNDNIKDDLHNICYGEKQSVFLLEPMDLQRVYKKVDSLQESELPDSFFKISIAGTYIMIDFLKRFYELLEKGVREKMYGIMLIVD